MLGIWSKIRRPNTAGATFGSSIEVEEVSLKLPQTGG